MFVAPFVSVVMSIYLQDRTSVLKPPEHRSIKHVVSTRVHRSTDERPK